MRRVVTCTILFLLAVTCCTPVVRAQHFDIAKNKKRVYVPFKVVRSMIVIQLKINNQGPYNFVLDTGVGFLLITDPLLLDSLNITNKRTIKIAGLGERENYQAVVAESLNVNIEGSLESSNISAAILKDDFFGLSGYAGMPIHGLLGYAFFSKLAVKVSFTDSTLVVMKPGQMRIFKKAQKIPLTIEEGKPYITTSVTLGEGKEKTSKLLIDLGAGHPLSLEKIDSIPQRSIKANLGVGLNGLIDGHMARVKDIFIGNYNIKNVITSFPADDPSIKTSIPRDGSVGMGLLKRFDIIFDYQNNAMYLKPNAAFKEIFEHDMSGLSYHAGGKKFDRLIIEKVDVGSAAYEMGIQADDEILSINFKPVNKMSLQQVDNLFKSKDGRTLLLEIHRDKTTDIVLLTLKRRI